MAIIDEGYRIELIEIYSDVFKSLHETRPRFQFDWSIEKLHKGLNAMDAEIEKELLMEGK